MRRKVVVFLFMLAVFIGSCVGHVYGWLIGIAAVFVAHVVLSMIAAIIDTYVLGNADAMIYMLKRDPLTRQVPGLHEQLINASEVVMQQTGKALPHDYDEILRLSMRILGQTNLPWDQEADLMALRRAVMTRQSVELQRRVGG
jgi:hypothetical protein